MGIKLRDKKLYSLINYIIYEFKDIKKDIYLEIKETLHREKTLTLSRDKKHFTLIYPLKDKYFIIRDVRLIYDCDIPFEIYYYEENKNILEGYDKRYYIQSKKELYKVINSL